jgi:hypothetical protein
MQKPYSDRFCTVYFATLQAAVTQIPSKERAQGENSREIDAMKHSSSSLGLVRRWHRVDALAVSSSWQNRFLNDNSRPSMYTKLHFQSLPGTAESV